MDMGELLSQARQLQEKLAKAQEGLAEKTVTASAGGGMVTVTVNGRGELVDLVIEKELINPDDPEMLRDLVMGAVNEGMRKAKELGKSQLSELTGGFKIPGLM